MSEWQPIESAPLDGSMVIVACPSMHSTGAFAVGEAYYRNEDRDTGWWWANTGPGDYHASPIIDTNNPPTHWMPLPPPPQTTKKPGHPIGQPGR